MHTAEDIYAVHSDDEVRYVCSQILEWVHKIMLCTGGITLQQTSNPQPLLNAYSVHIFDDLREGRTLTDIEVGE